MTISSGLQATVNTYYGQSMQCTFINGMSKFTVVPNLAYVVVNCTRNLLLPQCETVVHISSTNYFVRSAESVWIANINSRKPAEKREVRFKGHPTNTIFSPIM